MAGGETGAMGDGDFEALLTFLRDDRGFDFTGYKRPSLQRRVAQRMAEVGCRSYGEYLDYLQVHPEEFPALFDTMLINVTRLFRDPDAWNLLMTSVLPRLVAARPPEERIRAWVPGCASGEEAYSLAIALAEVIGPEWPRRLKVYATDVDEEALSSARQATYRRKDTAAVSNAILERYFNPVGDSFTVHKDLRRIVIFGRHDLVRDAPISRVDVLACRNTLMYFNAETQAQIVRRFQVALKESGVLFLGQAEMLLTCPELFVPVDLKHRLFVKVPAEGTSEQLQVLVERVEADDAVPIGERWVVRAALDASPSAQMVVDDKGRLAVVNQRARSLFGIGRDSVGRPFSDLDVSYQPLELRSIIDRVSTTRVAVVVEEVGWTAANGERGSFDAQVLPLILTGEDLVGVSITFVDVTRYRGLRDELEQANRDLETAYEELQSTNEELETTNAELQSTVEELETTNEELHSTNSALETMNEELQSTNEELQSMNDELRERTRELNRVNFYLESILASVRSPLAVLDEDLAVVAWNRSAEELWGVPYKDVRGRRFTELDIGLPMAEVADGLLDRARDDGGQAERTVDAVVRGRPLRCRVSCSVLARAGEGGGLIVFMEDVTAPGDD